MQHNKLLFLGTFLDEPYVTSLKPLLKGTPCAAILNKINTFAEIAIPCKAKGITGIISTSATLLKKLSGRDEAKIDNYAGSLFVRDGMEIVFIDPLKQLFTVPYGKFMAEKYISKLTRPQDWHPTPEFTYELLSPENIERIFHLYQDAFAIAVDIETYKTNLAIRCIGYTAVFIDDDGRTTTHSCVLPVGSEYALAWMRKFNWELKAPKVLQNGKYDISYLIRYSAPLYNYMYDTAAMFHSWYTELPKDLASLAAFFIRKSMYWKDLANTADLSEYYLYNAKDHHATACVFLEWIRQAPKWAYENYIAEFPLQFPCILAENIGIKRDLDKLKEARESAEKKIEEKNKSLCKIVGSPYFNVNSPPQVTNLRKVLGCADIDSGDEIALKKVGLRHPLNKKITDLILDIRGERKLVSTYLCDGKELNGRIYFALNPHGTDSGRLASKEHHFWCGLQIQNIPRGDSVKQTLIADRDFLFGECDLRQAETWDTAFIAGEENLIAALNSGHDFHSLNASRFFGVAYEKIYNDELQKTIDKVLRDLAKRVNHGVNYNMGPAVLVDTMGLDKIWEAKRLLELPRFWSGIQVAEFLIEQFHKTYPGIRKNYYEKVKYDIRTTGLLVGPTGWTRRCFGDPEKSKTALNAYVAHAPQSHNAMMLNKAYLKVFTDIAMSPDHRDNFKLGPQIHDSILFQFRKGHAYLADMVRERMEIPVTVKGADGKTRTFTVPADLKMGKDKQGAERWSLTE